MAFFPANSPATNYAAVSLFLNKVIAAGYTPNSALDIQSVLFAVVANLISGGSAPLGFTVYSLTLSPAQVAANTSAEQTFTATGVAATDLIVSVTKPTAQAGLGIVGSRVSGANEIAITFGNFTGSGITPTASQVYKVIVATP